MRESALTFFWEIEICIRNHILSIESAPSPYLTLYLLYGLTDNNSAWLQNIRIHMWAEEMELAGEF